MNTKHTFNPSVTVIMETRGVRPTKMARAINSFLDQDYPSAKLMIMHYHPQPLKLVGVPSTAKIEVRHCEDVYARHVYQHVNNLKNVETDTWTILDDDDWIDPGHLSQLVAAWNEASDRNGPRLQVCGQSYMAHYDDGEKPLSVRGWGASLFERLPPDEVDWCFKLFPPDINVGSDTWISWNSHFDKRLFDGKPTYHWDRTGCDHISQYETNRGETPSERFAQTMRFWELKIAARATKLEPVYLKTGD